MGAIIARLFTWRRLDVGERESLTSASSTDSLITHEQVSPTTVKRLEGGSDLKEPLIEKLPLDLLLRSVKNVCNF